MTVTLNELGNVLIRQLSDIVNGGDTHVPASPNSFITWCAPGIPFNPEDFDFAAKGIGNGTTAEEDKLLLQQAYNWAKLVDFVPNVDAVYSHENQEGMFRPDGLQRLSSLYGDILRASKVVSVELSEAEQAKIEKFRKLLRTTRTVTDLITDEEKQVTEDGPILKAYHDKMSSYISAALIYNAKRVAAQAAAGPEGKTAVADWSNNAELYRLQVRAAADAWVSGGYRNEVDQMNAYINQVTLRDMTLWKQRLLEFYQSAELNGLAPGQLFNFTTVVPGNFANSSGWTEYKVSHEHVNADTATSTTGWNASASGSIGLFSASVDAGGGSTSDSTDYSVNQFQLSMELAQVVIDRPWHYAEFFKNRGWTLELGNGWNYDEMPSDGALPKPKGNFIGYATTAIFARNIHIVSADFVSAYKAETSRIGVGGSVGYGPFRLSGGYSHSEGTTHYDATTDGADLHVPGMQVIGFVNHLLGKTPNPLETIPVESFH